MSKTSNQIVIHDFGRIFRDFSTKIDQNYNLVPFINRLDTRFKYTIDNWSIVSPGIVQGFWKGLQQTQSISTIFARNCSIRSLIDFINGKFT